MQPSSYDIQREVEALRDIKRRSTTPGALTIDPDLPNQSPPASPTNTYWSGTATPGSSPSLIHDDSSSSSHSSSSETTGSAGDAPANHSHLTDDPFHLFWVPASLHPEIAPAEFRAFLKEHARTADGSEGTLERSASTSSTLSGLSRKKSMLSRQYTPAEHDDAEEEDKILPLKRNRSTAMGNRGPQLTIKDLQKLEELAEEASSSDDPSKLRNMLRRSLSLNISPTAMDQMDNMPDMPDEADAPIIVPPPGQILRRAARTKIRKPGLPGDGGGHRFGSSRRGVPHRSQSASVVLPKESRTSDEVSSSDHDHNEPSPDIPTHTPSRSRSYSNETTSSIRSSTRPDSFSEEAMIYEAYARDEDEPQPPQPQASSSILPTVITSPPTPTTLDLPEFEALSSSVEELAPTLYHPQPQRLSPQTSPESSYHEPSRTPSPPSPSPPASTESLPAHTSVSSPPTASSISLSPSPQRKEKDKKGQKGLFKWGSDKSGKKKEKEKEREREKAEKEKEKDSSFFGSLFGSKKKQDDGSSPASNASGRETAERLLGQSKRAPTSPSPILATTLPGGNNYARYPIHVERAIYRLSHIKLANPRRPLYEQVLISNLMFWYLGVINKAQTTPAGPPVPNGPAANGNGHADVDPSEKERMEAEQRERESAEMERAEKEREQREREEREMEMKRKEGTRRGSLTKTPAATNGGRRAAEMPVRGPQYEMQHRVMEQEYGNYNGDRGGMVKGRPPQNTSHRQPHQAPPKLVQPQPQQSQDSYYNMEESRQQQQRLPAGAMPPVMNQNPSSGPPRKHSSSSPPPPSGGVSPQRRSRSPPHSNHSNTRGQTSLGSAMQSDGDAHGLAGSKLTGRSLSATAVPSSSPQMVNTKPVRKGHSAHAVAPPAGARRQRLSDDGAGEEEDVPLAMWQQRRK
ncbi:hypothetical protein PC9H_006503 [Pleurotus ostreatus]|uniref:Protein Zds1 C-terminal domain-containing protein n=1 Tax=Pleurotus ostreatus TaxID=5322 RepID=A0A8H6ZXQ8_PLEOS|nr:uncharacterized protein PC9H_006503 [Pleurotus ostreatus]KAF7430792.1 hypothetical protein PC9H_006503 [Pleurotus ostreatus]